MVSLTGGTLAVDIGGTGVKMFVLDTKGEPVNERDRLETPRPATPDAITNVITDMAGRQPAYERVSVGFPGVVIDSIVLTAPNLDGDWSEFPLGEKLQQRLSRPVRVANDADIQGFGAIGGHGVEMVLTLGTGLGSALFVDGMLVPNLELAHHPFRKKKTYEQYVGRQALEQVGKKKWNRRVLEILEQIQPIWNPRMIYIGGGNAKKLTVELPANVKTIDNVAGLLGGIYLWR
jgi:polyphosphate glucokinase